MFFVLSKTLYVLLMPLNWVILCLLFSLLKTKYKKQSFMAGLLLLLLLTNPFLSNMVIGWWEIPPVPVQTLPVYETGIVLGGLTSDKAPRDRVHVTGAADRVLQAVHLYRKGKIKKILLSGGSGKLIQDTVSEAELLSQILAQCDIPAQDILLEPESRNTYENAVNTVSLLHTHKQYDSALLITSAFHMRRSLACFQKQQLPVAAFSVDTKSEETKYTPDILFVPKTEALGRWELLIREVVGMLTYKIAGYI